MTEENGARLACFLLHWGRAGLFAALVRLAFFWRHHDHRIAPILAALAILGAAHSTIQMAHIAWERTAHVAALATFCALGMSGAIDLWWAGWWDIAFLLCALVAPVVWATSLIIWNLDVEDERLART